MDAAHLFEKNEKFMLTWNRPSQVARQTAFLPITNTQRPVFAPIYIYICDPDCHLDVGRWNKTTSL